MPPLLIGEVGWESRGPPQHVLAGTRRSQAKHLNRVYKAFALRRRTLNISAVLWYAWKDTPAGTGCTFCSNVGLFNIAGEAKPAWKTFRELTP